METTEELQTFLTADMVQPDLWGRLIARGSAWSLMRQDGVLPDGAPAFRATIEVDLAEHAFSVLRGAPALRERGEALDLATRAFERAANAFESLDRSHRRSCRCAAHQPGKTRVAEIAALMTLATGKRVLIVTPLRALSGLNGAVVPPHLRTARDEGLFSIRCKRGFRG